MDAAVAVGRATREDARAARRANGGNRAGRVGGRRANRTRARRRRRRDDDAPAAAAPTDAPAAAAPRHPSPPGLGAASARPRSSPAPSRPSRWDSSATNSAPRRCTRRRGRSGQRSTRGSTRRAPTYDGVGRTQRLRHRARRVPPRDGRRRPGATERTAPPWRRASSWPATRSRIRRRRRPGIVDLGTPDAPAPAWERYADLWRLTELLPSRDTAAERFEEATERVAERYQGDRGCLGGARLGHRGARRGRARREHARHLPRAGGGGGGGRRDPPFAEHVLRRRGSLQRALGGRRRGSRVARRRAGAPQRRSPARRDRGVRSLDRLGRRTRVRMGVRGRRQGAATSGTRQRPSSGPRAVGWGLISLTREHRARVGVRPECQGRRRARGRPRAGAPGVRATPIFEAPVRRRPRDVGDRVGDRHGVRPPGAGIEAYGRPSDAQIAAAGQCR